MKVLLSLFLSETFPKIYTEAMNNVGRRTLCVFTSREQCRSKFISTARPTDPIQSDTFQGVVFSKRQKYRQTNILWI